MTAPPIAVANFTGELHTASHTITITADLTVDNHGKATLVSAPIILTPDNRWLFRIVSPKGGRLAAWSSFNGTEPNGVTISTDHLTIEGDSPTADPNGPTTVTIRGMIARGTNRGRGVRPKVKVPQYNVYLEGYVGCGTFTFGLTPLGRHDA
jgi:hypothetical protein